MKNRDCTHEPAHYWLNYVRCKPNPDFADSTSITNQFTTDATLRKTYVDMVKSFKSMNIRQKTGKTTPILQFKMFRQLQSSANIASASSSIIQISTLIPTLSNKNTTAKKCVMITHIESLTTF
jgi:hypothetical protein